MDGQTPVVDLEPGAAAVVVGGLAGGLRHVTVNHSVSSCPLKMVISSGRNIQGDGALVVDSDVQREGELRSTVLVSSKRVVGLLSDYLVSSLYGYRVGSSSGGADIAPQVG